MTNRRVKLGELKQINLYVSPDLVVWLKLAAQKTHRSCVKYIEHLMETERTAFYEKYPELVPKSAKQLQQESLNSRPDTLTPAQQEVRNMIRAELAKGRDQ